MADGIKILTVAMTALLLSGCSLMNVKTTITDPGGKVWTVESKSDALCSIKQKDGTEIVVDNRGRPSVLETAFGLAMSNTNVNLGLSNEAQEVNN